MRPSLIKTKKQVRTQQPIKPRKNVGTQHFSAYDYKNTKVVQAIVDYKIKPSFGKLLNLSNLIGLGLFQVHLILFMLLLNKLRPNKKEVIHELKLRLKNVNKHLQFIEELLT